MIRSSLQSFDEAAELFGPPPCTDRFDDLFARLRLQGTGIEMVQLFASCLEMADQIEGECYSAIIEPSIGIMGANAEFEQLQNFFHKAAEFGEARMLARIFSALHTTSFASIEPQGTS